MTNTLTNIFFCLSVASVILLFFLILKIIRILELFCEAGKKNQKKIEIVSSKAHDAYKSLSTEIDALTQRMDAFDKQLVKLISMEPKVIVSPETSPSSSVKNYKDVLSHYLSYNYPDKHQQIFKHIDSLQHSINNPAALKSHIIEIAMNSNFGEMSSSKKDDFCQYANDFLARYTISFFYPQIGHEYNELMMSAIKQFSASKKVSSVLSFGVRYQERIILKADVYLG